MSFFDASTLFLSWLFSARFWAWASLSRSRSPLTTLNSDLASSREPVIDVRSPSSAAIFSFDKAKELRVLRSSALTDSSCNVVDASRDRHSSIWLWSWFLFPSRALIWSSYNCCRFTNSHLSVLLTKRASSNCGVQVAWAEYLVDDLQTSGRLRDECLNEAWMFGESDFWRLKWVYAWSSDPCDVKIGEEAPKIYSRRRDSKKKSKSEYLRSLVLSVVFCRLIGTTGDVVGIGDGFLGIEEKYDAESRGGTWESKRRCGCKRRRGRSPCSELGLFLLDSFKFDICWLKVPGWSKGLFVRSLSVCARPYEVVEHWLYRIISDFMG